MNASVVVPSLQKEHAFNERLLKLLEVTNATLRSMPASVCVTELLASNNQAIAELTQTIRTNEAQFTRAAISDRPDPLALRP